MRTSFSPWRFAITLFALLVALTIATAQDLSTLQKEIECGRMMAEQYKRMYPVSKNTALQERVNRIGRTLVAQLNPRCFRTNLPLSGMTP